MSEELMYPQWQQPLQDAILEGLRSSDFLEKLERIEILIRERMNFLTGGTELDEQQALTDALNTIRVLKQPQ